MKKFKIIGMFIAIIGMVFFVLGLVKCIIVIKDTGARNYTMGTIVRIEEYETGDPESPTEHKTFVELEINGEIIVSELNTYSSGYYVGQELEIYYLDNQLEMVYKEGSEILLILFPIIGAIVATFGIFLAFNKNLQTFLFKLPATKIT